MSPEDIISEVHCDNVPDLIGPTRDFTIPPDRARRYMQRLHDINEGKTPVRTPYVSIDIETTGLDPSYCQVIEFGAVLEDWVTPVEDLKRFHCYVYHDRIVGQPFALQMNATILKKLAAVEKDMNTNDHLVKEDGWFVKPGAMAWQFSKWLSEVGVDQETPILAAGKNFASFDRPFLERLPGWDIPFHHRVIDPAMLYWQPDTDATPPSTKTCMERGGIAGEVAHTAVEDAIGVIKMVRKAFAPEVAATLPTSAKEVAKRLSDQFRRNGQMG